MTKEQWTELARKVKATKVTDFELGVLAGLSSKYDFFVLAAKQESKGGEGRGREEARVMAGGERG